MTIGEKLKELRLSKNLSVKELSKLTDLSIVTIYNYEKGQMIPRSKALYKLAHALDHDIGELYDLSKQ